VTQPFLQLVGVDPRIGLVAGEGVAQHMRRHVLADPGQARVLGQEFLHPALGDGVAVAIDEEQVVGDGGSGIEPRFERLDPLRLQLDRAGDRPLAVADASIAQQYQRTVGVVSPTV